MATIYDNFFEDERMITKILNNKTIKENLNSELKTSIKIDEATRSYINKKLNINVGRNIPIKITSKNVKEHSDVTVDTRLADDTYMIYLSDTDTKLKINDTLYSLKKNKAITFGHNVLHSTVNGNTPRLMLGPFNRNGVRLLCGIDTSRHFVVEAYNSFTWVDFDPLVGTWVWASEVKDVGMEDETVSPKSFVPTGLTYTKSGVYVSTSSSMNMFSGHHYTSLKLTIIPSLTDNRGPKGVVLCGKC